MKINPKNFYQRQLDTLPPHFVNTVIKPRDTGHTDIEKIRKWIYEYCIGRYSITRDVIFEGDKPRAVIVLGFENPGDLTLFALSGLAQNNQK
jgi:hypothetical protein